MYDTSLWLGGKEYKSRLIVGTGKYPSFENMVGGLLGLDKPARDVVQDMRDEIRQVREFSSVWPDRPRVYFFVSM